MHDADHNDPHHPRMNLAPQQREREQMDAQESARAHPRGRVWWTFPPALRRGSCSHRSTS